MSNKYYNHSGEPVDLDRARAVQLRTEFAAIEQGFALVQQDIENALSSGSISIDCAQIINDNTVSTTTTYSSQKLVSGFAPINHTHTLRDLLPSGANAGQIVVYDGTRWVPDYPNNVMVKPKIVRSMTDSGVNDRDAYIDDRGVAYVFVGALNSWRRVGKLKIDRYGGSIACGLEHTIFLLEDGTCKAIGGNGSGRLGNGVLDGVYTTPVDVIGVSNCVAVAAGARHSVFLLADGTCMACGNNMYGQLGDGTTTNRATPVQVSGITNCVAISAGFSHTAFLLSDGTCKATGDNTHGQLGDGTTTSRTTPVNVSNITDCVSVSCGDFFTVFLMFDGTCKSVGYNATGQLGDGTRINRNLPVSVVGINNCSQISAGMSSVLFLTRDGKCKITGDYLLGNGEYILTPKIVDGIDNCVFVCSGRMGFFYHVVLSDGTCKGFGENSFGELGDGSRGTYRYLPVDVVGVSDCVAVYSGGKHTVFIKRDGTCLSTGLNDVGQLCDGTTTIRSIPVQAQITSVKVADPRPMYYFECTGVGA